MEPTSGKTPAFAEPASYDWNQIVDDLNRLLRLRTTPIGMKLFATVRRWSAFPSCAGPNPSTPPIRSSPRPRVSDGRSASRPRTGAQCAVVIGLQPADEDWLSGNRMAGVWYSTLEDSSAHQHAMDVVPHGRYAGMAVSPLTSGRLDPPDICLIYGTPGQMIIFINGLQWAGYKKFQWGCVRRVGVRGFMGARAQDGRAERIDPLLRRAPVWRRAGR